MKKVFLLALFVMISFSSCLRTFHSYVSDGKGGNYRIGGKWVMNIPTSLNYVEHCKPEGNALVCREVKLTGPGL